MKKLALIILIVVIVMGAYLWATDFFAIDDCLDSGGIWNEEYKICEHSYGATEWETYESDNYGFSIDLPEGWKFSPPSPFGIYTSPESENYNKDITCIQLEPKGENCTPHNPRRDIEVRRFGVQAGHILNEFEPVRWETLQLDNQTVYVSNVSHQTTTYAIKLDEKRFEPTDEYIKFDFLNSTIDEAFAERVLNSFVEL